MIKRIFVSLFLGLTVALFSFSCMVVSDVYAVDVTSAACQGIEDSAACADSIDKGGNPLYGPNGVITVAIKGLSIVLAVAAVVVLMFAGLRYITSQGDSSKITQSRNAIIYAVIGMVIAALAQVIVNLVLNRL